MGTKLEYNKKELEFITDKIDNDEKFSVLSFCDGEWALMFQRENHNELAEREYFTEEIWVGLFEALQLSRKPDVYLTTTMNTGGEKGYEDLHKKGRKLMRLLGIKYKKGLKDARVFYDTLHQCYRRNPDAIKDYLKFIRVLRKKKDKIVLVGDEHLFKMIDEGFLPDAKHILIPEGKASRHIHDIVYPMVMHKKPAYFFLSCGFATNTIIKTAYPYVPKGSMLDVGAMWDFILNEGLRAEPYWAELKGILKKELNI